MSKYSIEIPDNEVGLAIGWLRTSGGGHIATDIATHIADQLEDQRPGLPVPTKGRAVVRTPSGIAILADPAATGLPWMITTKDPKTPYGWVKHPGKVLEVIYEGDES